MDETGRRPSHGSTKVLVRSNAKAAYKIGGENRENITIIECICADGTAIRPLLIYKGKRIVASMRDDTVDWVAGIAVSDKDLTDDDLGLVWLKKT